MYPSTFTQRCARSGGENPRRARAGQPNLRARPFAAAHGKYQRAGLDLLNAAPPASNKQAPLRVRLQHHAVQQKINLQIGGFLNKALSISRAR